MATKKENENKVDKAFKGWESALKELTEGAEKCYMPLLAESLKLSTKILKTYETSFKKTLDN